MEDLLNMAYPAKLRIYFERSEVTEKGKKETKLYSIKRVIEAKTEEDLESQMEVVAKRVGVPFSELMVEVLEDALSGGVEGWNP